MKFRVGDSVEVLRKDCDPCGSWFPGNIFSVDGNEYIVKYKFFMDNKGEREREKVNAVDVRSQPPNEKGNRWKVGDITEVFDIQCWRIGKIVKVLKNNRFVIRLFGSIQLKEFHKSNLRTRQTWDNRWWSVIEKVAQKKQLSNNAGKNPKQSQSFVSRAMETAGKDLLSGDKDEHGDLKDGHHDVKICLPVRTVNRNQALHVEPSLKNLFTGHSCKKRNLDSHAGRGRPPMRTVPFYNQVDDISYKVRVVAKVNKGSIEMDAKMDNANTDWLHHCPRPFWSTEDSNQCSVASCSSDDFAGCPDQNPHKVLENKTDNSDAESSFPCLSGKKHLPWSSRNKTDVDIHELELRAYKSTVQAMHASGPLSWEQESLLTNLRVSLHISDEEHLLQLKHLLSAQAL